MTYETAILLFLLTMPAQMGLIYVVVRMAPCVPISIQICAVGMVAYWFLFYAERRHPALQDDMLVQVAQGIGLILSILGAMLRLGALFGERGNGKG